MSGKGIPLVERTFVQNCIVGLLMTRPESLFEIGDGKTENMMGARAWKAASETIGTVIQAWSSGSSKRSESDAESTSGENPSKEKMQQKQSMLNPPRSQTQTNSQNIQHTQPQKMKTMNSTINHQ